MSDLNAVISQIKPCDTAKPYLFISYSSQDSEIVWPDVLRLQQDGWNVWLDEKNLDKTKASWNVDAIQAINSRHCKLLVFYVSSHSLRSNACLQEWRETRSDRTIKNHRGEIPTLVVEAEPIDNILQYCEKVHMQIDDEIEDDKQFEKETDVLYEFQEKLFQNTNDRVRIRSKNMPGGKVDYYEDMERNFPSTLMLQRSEAVSAAIAQSTMVQHSQFESDPAVPAKPAVAPTVPTPSVAAPKRTAAGDLHTVKTLGTTDIKYNICTFGSKFDIGAGAPVTLVMGNQRYERKMHNVTKGRVDSLKKLYTDHGLKLGDVLDAHYCAAENTIYLTKIDPSK